MKEKILKLTDPVTIAGKEYTELAIREPRAKHLKGLKVGYSEIDTDTLFLAASRCVVGALPAVIDELSISDFAALVEIVMDFLPDGLNMIGKQQSGT